MAQPRVLGAGKGDRPAGVCAERLGRAGQRGHHHPPPGPPVLEALQVGCSPCPVPLIQTPYPRDLLVRSPTVTSAVSPLLPTLRPGELSRGPVAVSFTVGSSTSAVLMSTAAPPLSFIFSSFIAFGSASFASTLP